MLQDDRHSLYRKATRLRAADHASARISHVRSSRGTAARPSTSTSASMPFVTSTLRRSGKLAHEACDGCWPERITRAHILNSYYDDRGYAVALFRISKPHFLPAAAWYVPIVGVRFFPRVARKKPHTLKCKIPLCRRLGTPTA